MSDFLTTFSVSIGGVAVTVFADSIHIDGEGRLMLYVGRDEVNKQLVGCVEQGQWTHVICNGVPR